MKITYPSSTSLRIRVVPWFLWVVSALFTAVGLFMLGSGAGQTRTLHCTRVSSDTLNCTINQSLLGIPTKTTVLKNVYGAKLAASSSSSSTTYRVEFDTAVGTVPMSSISSSGTSDKQPFVDQVNRMVRDASIPTLTVRNLGIGDLLVDLFFIGVGLCVGPLFGASIVTWTFDRLAGTFTVRRARFGRAQVVSYALSDIRNAVVLRSTSSKGTAMSRIALRLHSGDELPLTGYASSGNSAKDEAAVSTIQQFIGLAPTVDDELDTAQTAPVAPSSVSSAAPAATLGMPVGSPLAAGVLPGAVPYASIHAPEGIGGIVARVVGIALLQRSMYRSVAEDPTMTLPAGGVVVVVAIVVGAVSGLTSTSFTVNGANLPPGFVHAAAAVTVQVLSAAIGWLVSSLVFASVAKGFGGNTNIGEMARVLGFTSVFNLLWAVPVGFIPALLLAARGTMLAISEAAEFDTRRVITTTLIAWAITLVVISVVTLVLNLAIIGGLAAAYGQPA